MPPRALGRVTFSVGAATAAILCDIPGKDRGWRRSYEGFKRVAGPKPPTYFTTRRCGRFTASSDFAVAGGGSGGAFSAENIIPCPFSCA